ncbi:hypothetical protein Tco_1122139 [Tanacetum coccineum]|uniref:Transposase (Putative), gypsy type n=1 Tax=Tanacetum coccineum TaxID=301880 RepID=A0ABQ5IZQ1_9ASTR
MGGVLEKDSAPHFTARQEQTVKLLESHKAHFRRYPECFLCLVGLSPYYPFDENSYPTFEYPDGSEMGLFDFIKTADPRKVQAVEVQKGDDQVTLLKSTRHCFMPLVIPAARGSSSAAAAEVSALTGEGQEDVAPEEAYLELADPDEGTTVARQSEDEVVTEQPKKVKKKRLLKQSDVLPAKKLRVYHPTLISGTGGKTLAGLEQMRLAGSRLPDREQLAFCNTLKSEHAAECLISSTLGILVDTTVAATTSTKAAVTTKFATDVNPDLAGPSQPEESEGSDESFYEHPTLDPSEAKRWYVPRWNITNDSLLGDGFSCRTLVDRVSPPAFFSALRTMDYDQLYTEFNVGVARQICLGAEVRSRAEHELELKEKLRAKYESQEIPFDRIVVGAQGTVTQKDHDISLLNSRATCLASTLDDAKVACAEAGNKITSLASERDRLASEDFKEKMEIQQEEQAQELYNRVAELEAHVMDVSGRLEGEFYPAYLTTLAGRRWLLTHGIQLALLKCLKSSKYQGIMGHALGRAIDFGMHEGLEDGYEHVIARRNLSTVDAYNPEVAKAIYINAVKALEDVDFPLVNLLKSKKDAEMDEVLDCFLLDGPLAGLPKAAYLQPCIKQLSIPIHHAGDKTVVEETSMSFALMNVHARAVGAKKHVAALRQLMMEIVSAPLSSQTWVGEASTFVAPFSVEDYDEEDIDEALGSVVVVPKLEIYRF